MNHSSHPQTIAWFQERYRSGYLELRPPFQRKFVWTEKQRSALIESILMDIPIPEIYVQVTQTPDGNEHFGIVDGQQRLRTILQFVGVETTEDQDGIDGNLFALNALPKNSEFRNLAFRDLQDEPRKMFFRYMLTFRYLHTEDTKEVENIFKRLNKFTLALKPQELRNATFHGPFAKLSETLADNEYWAVNRIISPASIRRMGDIEMMSDFLIGLLHGPQGGSSKIIDDYYEEYEEFEDEFPEQNRVKRQFDATLSAIVLLFPNISEVPRWSNRADFYSLFVALGNLLRDYDLPQKTQKLSESLIKFGRVVSLRLENSGARTSKESGRYARAIEKGVNDKARRMDRYVVLTKLIEPFLVKKKL